jgi:hypothetical protein
MANLLIIVAGVIIGGAGVLAVAKGVMNERASRQSSRGSPISAAGPMADEIQEWLKTQD